MENYKIVRGQSEEDIWNQINSDLGNIEYPFVYGADIRQDEKSVFLNIEADIAGGFESGFQATSLTAPVPIQFTTFSSRLNEPKSFRFALHD